MKPFDFVKEQCVLCKGIRVLHGERPPKNFLEIDHEGDVRVFGWWEMPVGVYCIGHKWRRYHG